MPALLLRIKGPMQSWGTRSRFQNRDTEREPTLSGIIGICAAAMGIGRDENLSMFNGIKMHVRVDREGKPAKDFQTAQDVVTADGKLVDMISDRWHLQDAAFLVCLEGGAEILHEIHDKLRRPVWSLYLGRKSYVPSESIWLEDGFFEEKTIDEIFASYPLIDCPRGDRIRIIRQTDDYLAESRKDTPVSFNNLHRVYENRYIVMTDIDAKPLMEVSKCI